MAKKTTHKFNVECDWCGNKNTITTTSLSDDVLPDHDEQYFHIPCVCGEAMYKMTKYKMGVSN